MAEYKHGSMDIAEHERTFAGLIKAAVWVVAVVFVALIFLAIVGT